MSQDDFRSINIKLDQIGSEQKEAAQKIGAIKERLFDPDDGLYSRIRDLKQWADKHELEDNEIRKEVLNAGKENKERYEDLHEMITKSHDNMEPISDDYKIRMGRRKWIDRLMWIVVTALIGVALKNFVALDDIHERSTGRKKGADTTVMMPKE